jgi:hypothetical protein
MPIVNGRHYAYSSRGRAAAKAAAKRTGQTISYQKPGIAPAKAPAKALSKGNDKASAIRAVTALRKSRAKPVKKRVASKQALSVAGKTLASGFAGKRGEAGRAVASRRGIADVPKGAVKAPLSADGKKRWMAAIKAAGRRQGGVITNRDIEEFMRTMPQPGDSRAVRRRKEGR